MGLGGAWFVVCGALCVGGRRWRRGMTGPAEDAEGTGESTPAGSQHYVESSQHSAVSSQRNDGSSQCNTVSSQRKAKSSQHNMVSSQHNAASSQHNAPVLADAELLAIAAPARGKARLPPSQMKELIRQLCERRSPDPAKPAQTQLRTAVSWK